MSSLEARHVNAIARPRADTISVCISMKRGTNGTGGLELVLDRGPPEVSHSIVARKAYNLGFWEWG